MTRVFVLMLAFLTGCHPLSMFTPKAIKPIKPTDLTDAQPPVDVAVDRYGIPFIKAHATVDAVFALGYMHARDRLFQLDLTRHAALGRTAELFGERGLTYDRRLRLLTYRLDEQLDHINEREKTILSAYVRGVNEGAKQRGKTAEHWLLGVEFEEFTMRDVIAIARLQTWYLAADMFSEITRLKIAQADLSDQGKKELLAAMDDRGTSIISDRPDVPEQKMVLPTYLKTQTAADRTSVEFDNHEVVQTSGGASNAWAIQGALSADGHAMLMNDPHLQHTWPSNFYLVTLGFENKVVSGATFVGLPGVVIGATDTLSWGVTASFLNTQDTVYLASSSVDPKNYVVDGKELALQPWPQKFCLNKRKKCLDEMAYTSIFGPVVDHSFDPWIEEKDRFAVQWTGFNIDQHRSVSGGFFELAQAPDVKHAVEVIQAITFPGVNLVLADSAGNVGFAYAGLVPLRDQLQNPFLPLDGRLKSSQWRGFSPNKNKPAVVNPALGYVVTANQNIYGKNTGNEAGFAQQGAPPYRALQIKERIEAMRRDKTLIDFEELSSVQLDDTSLEAKELASRLGQKCVEAFADANGSRKEFAEAIRDFDGRFTTNSLGAFPYEQLMHKISSARLKSILGDNTPESISYVGQVRFAVKNALLKEINGHNTGLFTFNAPRNLDSFLRESCEAAYTATVKRAGYGKWAWRWGRHHYLQRQSPLARAPFIGSMFRDRRREVAGTHSSPMAEGGTPVTYGANLRFRVKMTTPPQIFAVIDSGNSGALGDKNAFDQAELWHAGKSIEMASTWERAQANAVTQFQLMVR